MKIKKLKKLSQKLFSLLLIYSALSSVSVYAAGEPPLEMSGTLANSTNYDLSIQVPDYFSIALDSSSVLTASSAAITNNGNTLTLGNDLSLVYNIQTSVNTGLLVTSPNIKNTNFAEHIYIVFAKDGATESAISNCTPNDTTNDNPNAIAFEIRANTPTATVGTAPTVSSYSNFYIGPDEFDSGFIYSFTPGSSTISLTIDANSTANTYGSNDTKGEYTASITVTQILQE